ncbi:MAG TPA: phosphoheptose isomerase [Cyclobacteriaceae bacterium]|nr:phosphoheptose isomerase [Cyclobacteriaceae bacterium]
MAAFFHLNSTKKGLVFPEIENYLNDSRLTVQTKDIIRPWGGFFVIAENLAEQFISQFFPDEKFEELKKAGKLSPKILVVQPNMRLSWQYHHRRAELWRVISGKVGVTISDTDAEDQKMELNVGESISLRQGQRHRLRGLDQWGVVAEIWKHTDANNPSDENDIVRVQDDFGR